MAITSLTIEQIEAATEYCIKVRTDKYIPSTAQFIEIAEQIDKDKIKHIRISAELEEQEPVHLPAGKSKVKRITQDLVKTMQKETAGVKTTYDRPKILISEYCLPVGKDFSYQAKGFHEADYFRDQVYKAFSVMVGSIHHKTKRDKKCKTESGRIYSTYVECEESHKGAEQFTIGRT